jgi:hypothetical protein
LDILVTGSAKDQRFPATGHHELDPSWFLSAWVFFQIFERSDVMHLYGGGLAGGSALLADLCEQSFFQFGPPHRLMRGLVVEGCFDIPLK